MLTVSEQLILLNRTTEIGSTALYRLIQSMGSLDRLWQATAGEISQAARISPVVAERIAACRSDTDWLEKETTLAVRSQIAIVALGEEQYPKALLTIADPPLVLYIKGKADFEKPGIAVVGSRQASLYGIQCAERLGFELAEKGLTVISGLALGIDAAAHRGAVKARGVTFAVLGSGLAEIYPERNVKLATQIIETGGAIISEYPLQTQPLPYHFPRRNRIISGLSLGVVVVEARQRSGALITADCALEQGREVFAVPGPIGSVTSQGTHGLLKQGARLVAHVDDILEELGLKCEEPSTSSAQSSITGSEHQVLLSVTKEPSSIDVIAAKSTFSAAAVCASLLQLELKGCIKQLPGKRFVRV